MLRALLVLWSLVTPPPSLQSCIEYWKKEMGLRDWQIELEVVSADELQVGHLGEIEPNRSTQTATLRIVRTDDSTLPRNLARAEQRLTIIHEMVHLRKFAKYDGNWGSELETDTEVGRWIAAKRRWRESLVVER